MRGRLRRYTVPLRKAEGLVKRMGNGGAAINLYPHLTNCLLLGDRTVIVERTQHCVIVQPTGSSLGGQLELNAIEMR